MVLTEEVLCAEPYSQRHLFEGANDVEKAFLLRELREVDAKLTGGGLLGYLERARRLLKESQDGVNVFEGLVPAVPQGQCLSGEFGPGSSTWSNFEKIGMGEIPQITFCLVAGGLGERLGYPGIKVGIPSEVTTGTTFLELFARFILAFETYGRNISGKANLVLPFAIMTSGDTHDATVELLENNSYFGLCRDQVSLLKQELVPALEDATARIAKTNGRVVMKPHGHGDVHSLLHQHGLIKKWLTEDRRWLLCFQDTNSLPFRCLCAVLGVSAKNGFAMNTMTVPRVPKEALGAICTLKDPKKGTNLTINVEYNQLEPLLQEAGGDVPDESGYSPYPGNINVLLFDLEVQSQYLEKTGGIVPEFVNPKWTDSSKTAFKTPTRLECMMQDFPRQFGSEEKVGFTQLDRYICRSCVKNHTAEAAKKNITECAFTAEADTYYCGRRLLELAGADVEIGDPVEMSFLGVKANVGPLIVLQPSFGISLEQIKEKVRGKIRITASSTLVLEGNVIVDGLVLDGALRVKGSGILKDNVIKNAGALLEPIPADELESCDPSLQIRGYKVSWRGVKDIELY